MNDNEIINRAHHLKTLQTHPGWLIFKNYMTEVQMEGFENFIKLPAEKITSKQAFQFKSDYTVIKKLKDWMEDEIADGEKSEKILSRQPERARL